MIAFLVAVQRGHKLHLIDSVFKLSDHFASPNRAAQKMSRNIASPVRQLASGCDNYYFFQKTIQKYLKFSGPVILNLVLMKIRIISGSHQIGPSG